MKPLIHVNAFDMATPGHINQGTWTLPGNRRVHYNALDEWVELARLLERGLFDAIFFADVLGTYNVYKGSREAAVRSGVQIPNLDPTLIIAAMAAHTEHLGFAVTVNTLYEPPFGWARRLSTLDHLTNGRFAWNVVTGYLPDAAKNFGVNDQLKHDDRYDVAEEFMHVIYELLERSWDEDAVVRDVDRGVYTEPSRLHEINVKGRFFEVAGPHLSEPSPQRTPLVFQAGTSERGMAFAAHHAEGIFMHPRDKYHGKEVIDALRRRAVDAGRNADDIKPMIRLEVVTGYNQDEVDAKVRLIDQARDLEGQLAAFGGWSGIDLSGGDTDEYLQFRRGDAIQSVEKMWAEGPNRKKIGEFVQFLEKPSNDALFIAGTPDAVTDEIESLIDISGAAGINLTSHLSPGTLVDFVNLIVPELQKRGRYRTAYTPGETLRERFYGPGQRYARTGHPAAKIAACRPPLHDAAE